MEIDYDEKAVATTRHSNRVRECDDVITLLLLPRKKRPREYNFEKFHDFISNDKASIQ